MWMRLMLLAFFANGLGAFGLRVLAGMGVAGKYNLQYLGALYLGGAVLACVAYLIHNRRPERREIAVTAGMALASVLGQLGMMTALERGLPGFIVFPVCIAGGMLLVLVAAAVFFGERLSLYGYLGVGIGFASLVLLAFPK
jgi:drug/metabolite transporter (DMT)-like permease